MRCLPHPTTLKGERHVECFTWDLPWSQLIRECLRRNLTQKSGTAYSNEQLPHSRSGDNNATNLKTDPPHPTPQVGGGSHNHSPVHQGGGGEPTSPQSYIYMIIVRFFYSSYHSMMLAFFEYLSFLLDICLVLVEHIFDIF